MLASHRGERPEVPFRLQNLGGNGSLGVHRSTRTAQNSGNPLMATDRLDNLASLTSLPSLDEWKECRAVIGRLDATLADLRKYSFSLVTILITAAAFVSLFSSQNPPGSSQNLPSAPKAAVIIVLLVLTTAPFLVDRYYSLLQSGAVERTLDIERQFYHRTDPQYLTEQIALNATHSRAAFIAMFLYLALEASLVGIGIAMFGWNEAHTGFEKCLELFVQASARHRSSTMSLGAQA